VVKAEQEGRSERQKLANEAAGGGGKRPLLSPGRGARRVFDPATVEIGCRHDS
jgi:hypothetical protein